MARRIHPMKLTEQRLKQIIKEEARLLLLTEEMKKEVLEEGVVDWFKKVLGIQGWEALIDDAEDGEVELPVSFLDFPSKKRIAYMALASLLATGAGKGLGHYADNYDPAEVAAAERFADAIADGQEKAKGIQNFREIAQLASAEGPTIQGQDAIDQYLDDVRNEYNLQSAPLGVSRGLFIDGDPTKPARGFAYVPADQISDDTMMPLTGMTKADYEQFLRMNWLLGDPQGDERLEQYVMGGGRAGSSIFWAYQDSLYSPVADMSGHSDPETAELMVNMYGPAAEEVLLLPLEWSVAYDIYQKRTPEGRAATAAERGR